jgi:hypothetical protein
MAEHLRQRHRDVLKLDREVRMADAARLDANQHFARTGLRNIALNDLEWTIRRAGHGGSDLH